MEKNLFNLKFSAKQLEHLARKAEKDSVTEKQKIKLAIQKSNMEGARIHAENSIRNANQALNYRRMAARIDAVAARVQTAMTTKQVTAAMGGVVRAMESAMQSMNLEKISNLMDRFEREFENLDVQTQVMDKTMANSTTLSTPQNEVDMLMQSVADEAHIELKDQLPGTASTIGPTASASAASAKPAAAALTADEDDLSARLARLRDN